MAERRGIHYPTSISSNLVRRVVDRVGLRCEAAYSEESLQLACREKAEQPADTLVVATDGSMLLTREEGWKEAKVAVVARAGAFQRRETASPRRRGSVRRGAGRPRGVQESLAAALAAESADEVRGIWTVASELCPFAIKVLYIPHAIHFTSHRGSPLNRARAAASK